SRKPSTRAAITAAARSGGTPTFSTAPSPCLASSCSRSTRSTISLASPSSRRPASVSRTWRPPRSNSRTPSSSSRRLMRWLSGGWAMPSRIAALPKWSSSASTVKYRRCRTRSMTSYYIGTHINAWDISVLDRSCRPLLSSPHVFTTGGTFTTSAGGSSPAQTPMAVDRRGDHGAGTRGGGGRMGAAHHRLAGRGGRRLPQRVGGRRLRGNAGARRRPARRLRAHPPALPRRPQGRANRPGAPRPDRRLRRERRLHRLGPLPRRRAGRGRLPVRGGTQVRRAGPYLEDRLEPGHPPPRPDRGPDDPGRPRQGRAHARAR